MSELILFLLKSILVSGILFAWYALALRNRRMHRYNRFFLLGILYLSIQVPLLHFSLPDSFASAVPAALGNPHFVLHSLPGAGFETAAQHSIGTISYGTDAATIILMLSGMVSLVLVVRVFLRVIAVYRLERRYPATANGRIRLVHTDLPDAPFSFLNRIFWRSDIPLGSDTGRMILQHEMAHVRQGHTCDRLITQVWCALFWMNPFYRLIRKELAMVHEFLADEEALAGNTGATDYGKAFALMLLQVHQRPTTSNPGHHFFSSPVKRRLTMLQTTRMVRASVLRRLAVLPLLAGSLLAFSFSPRTAPTPAAKKIVLVIDAGHGGKDHGCRSGQYTEKDLNLKVAEHLLKLAPRYNVAAHLTRSTDEELSLQQRVERANKVHPDILLSLHVDDQPAKANGKGTFDVIVSSRNPRQELSRRLATELYRHASRPEWEQGAMPADRNPYVLSHSLAAAVVIEMGNIRNAAQMQRLNDEDALDEFCSHILEAAVAAHQ